MIGKTPRILQGAKSDRAQLDKIRASISRWKPVQVELLNYRKDGSEFWVELNIVPVANESGWFTHWVSVQRETSERRRAEQALEKSRAELEARVTERTRELSEVNASLREQITVRERAEAALQYRVEFEKLIATVSTEFIGLAPNEIDDGINGALQRIGEFAGVERSYVYLFSGDGTKADNTHEWCAAGIEPQIEAMKNLPVSTFSWWMERLNRFDNIHIPRVANLPAEANPEKEIFDSKSVQSLIAVPMIYGKSLLGFLGFDAVYAEKTWSEEIIALLRIVGETFANALSRQRAEAERNRLEEQLLQAQKMESIGTLAGGVAHDFNNLLTVISGNTQLALARLAPDDRMQQRLVEIDKAAGRAATLTRQLLAFSRRQQLERKTINLDDTIQEIMKLLMRVIGADVEVRFHAATNLAAVFADPAQIEQVIMNLAINARDAMPHGGRLIIETNNMTLDHAYLHKHPLARLGRYVQIKVSDTGTGMDAETKARIFEPFFTTKAIGKGTGLGLAMVYGIVRQHEGLIEVYSEPGQGTTFKIYLPVDEKPTGAEMPQMQAPLRGGQETILVADDEEPLRELAQAVLEELGYVVLLAQNGAEAVEIYQANRRRIDLVILDVVMPGMGGHEAYEQIGSTKSEVPVIFMTGYSAEMVQNKFIETNNLPLLQKPYSVEVLGRKVREVLDAHHKD